MFIQEKPWYPILEEGYVFINDIPVEQRVRSIKPPMTKDQCEVLLMVGLPGAGKTHWANQIQLDQPEKRWYVLGTNNIIDRMKVRRISAARSISILLFIYAATYINVI